jgi:uncharacterized membrane protein YkgB
MRRGPEVRDSIASGAQRIGSGVALIGIILPLLFIGGLKFTAPEVEALEPLISSAPWLAWLYPLLGKAGASYFLGVVEILAALLLMASLWSPRTGVAGGALAALIFFVTSTLLIIHPAWDERLGGFPALGPLGQFLIKDVTLLGVAIFVMGSSLARLRSERLSDHG